MNQSKKMSRKNVTIRLKPAKIKKLTLIANKLNVRRSEIIRKFIDAGLESHNFFLAVNDSYTNQNM
jgi:predicted DNA-binding protein